MRSLNYRPLTNWIIDSFNGKTVSAVTARRFVGEKHAVLGNYTIDQCDRLERRLFKKFSLSHN